MKRLLTLIKKIYSQLVGSAEQAYDKHKDPVLLMREAISKLDDERQKIKERYIEAEEKFSRSKNIVQENEEKLANARRDAKQAKLNGEVKKATLHAQRIVKLQDWLDRYTVNSGKLETYKANLKAVYEDLGFKREDYKLEVELIESSKSMAEFRIDKVKHIDGFDGSSIDEVIKEAREKIESLNITADAHEDAYENLVEPEQKRDEDNVSDKVQKVLDEL